MEKDNTTVMVKTSVTNTGTMAGAEVVRIYFGSQGAEEHRPVKLLKGFKRVELRLGETKKVINEE